MILPPPHKQKLKWCHCTKDYTILRKAKRSVSRKFPFRALTSDCLIPEKACPRGLFFTVRMTLGCPYWIWRELLHTVKGDLRIASPPTRTQQSLHRFLNISKYWGRYGARTFHSHLITDSPIWKCQPHICWFINECNGSTSVHTSSLYKLSEAVSLLCFLPIYDIVYLFLYVRVSVCAYHVYTSSHVSVHYIVCTSFTKDSIRGFLYEFLRFPLNSSFRCTCFPNWP